MLLKLCNSKKILNKLVVYLSQHLHKEEKGENIIKILFIEYYRFLIVKYYRLHAKYASYNDKKHKLLSVIQCLIHVLQLSRHITVHR